MTTIHDKTRILPWRLATRMVATAVFSLAVGACAADGEQAELDLEEAPESDIVFDQEAEAELRRQVEELLAEHPAAEQLDDYEVEIEPGAVVTLARPVQARAAVAGPDCPYYNSCFYQHANYGYPRLKLYECRGYHLTPMGWGDRISSWHNNQSGGAVATVWNWTGQWTHLFTAGVGSSPNVGAAHNDKADYIINCP